MKIAESFVKKNDFENALIWYEKVLKNGDFESTAIIGDIYYIGDLVRKKDCNKALYYYKKIFDCYHDDIEDSEIALRIAEIYSKGIWRS